MKVTPEDVLRIVEMNRKTASFTPGALVAIVAPDPLPYAMARLWHSYSDVIGWKANIFHTRADAIKWLRNELITKAGSISVLDQFPYLQPAG